MKLAVPSCVVVWLSSLVLASSLVAAEASSPSVAQALRLRPLQDAVEFTQPTPEDAAKCTISARRIDGNVGWVVEDAQGRTLRRFIDTNGDNVVDQWSYYDDGLEVYRDVDTDYNGRADQYRWFHTGGTRWGLDKNEDEKIDAWKMISPEEVTAEVIAALARQDTERFARLLLKPDELDSLALGKETSQRLSEKIAQAAEHFQRLAAQQQTVTPQTRWIQFSGVRPGIVPAGAEGSSKDLQVYENVVAIVQTAEKHEQVHIGTLVRVGDVWRVIDAPEAASAGESKLASGFFFRTSVPGRGDSGGAAPSEEAERLLAELEELDRTAEEADTPAEKADFNARRADLLKNIARRVQSAQDRAMWLRQLADMVSAAVQAGTYPQGGQTLGELFDELRSGSEADKELAPYVKFRQLTAEYALSLQTPKPDFAKIQEQWLKDLEQYVADYPSAPDSAEALLQLGIAKEFAGQEGEAKEFYAQVVQGFPRSSAAQKAAGARTRLDSVGKGIALAGKSPSGTSVDLAKYRGKVVLIQYWATWCQPAKNDMPVLKELQSKYRDSFSVIGVSLDSDRKDLEAYLAENRLPWPQIFEEGGLDSPPANRLGILTLPTMILVDKQGKVVDYNIQTAELEEAVKKLIGTPVARKPSSRRPASR